MSLALLPEEVLEIIVKQLTAKDLVACSAVSSKWREAFNKDLFWKWFCFKEVKDYLEKTICEVERPFQPIQSSEDRLQTICDWRVCYMRETHLINNWRSGNFSAIPVRAYDNVQFIEMKVDRDGAHWLFLWFSFSIEIWNVNSTPKLVKTLSIFPEFQNPVVMVVEGKLVVIQCNIVTTYSLNHNVDTLFRCTLEESKTIDSTLWNSTLKSDIPNRNEEDDYRFHSFGNLLVGHKRIPNPKTDFSMHIWDLNHHKKIKTESMLKDYNKYITISFSSIFKIDESQGLIRIIFLSRESELNSLLFVYDFKRLRFKDTKIECKGVVVWCGCAQNIIVTFSSDPGTIKFFNSSSSKLLSTIQIGLYANSEQMQLVDSFLLYCMFNSMYVLDIHNQQVVHHQEFTFSSFVRKMTVVEPGFVVVWLLERGESPGSSSSYQEVWDLKNLSRKLIQFSSELGYEMLTSSPSLVKQVARQNGVIHICTFW